MAPETESSNKGSRGDAYWRAVRRRTVVLLAVWLLVGPIAGILVVDRLNAVRIAGLPLGFWIAQQGAIYVFVILIFAYAWLSQRADHSENLERRD